MKPAQLHALEAALPRGYMRLLASPRCIDEVIGKVLHVVHGQVQAAEEQELAGKNAADQHATFPGGLGGVPREGGGARHGNHDMDPHGLPAGGWPRPVDDDRVAVEVPLALVQRRQRDPSIAFWSVIVTGDVRRATYAASAPGLSARDVECAYRRTYAGDWGITVARLPAGAADVCESETY